MPTSRSWADLPDGIIRGIAKDLPFADFVKSQSVCSDWHAVLDQPQDVLLVGHRSSWTSKSFIAFEFYSVVRDRFLPLPPPLDLRLVCRGSSRGWLLLAVIGFVFPRLMLYHPFCHFIIELPTCTAPSDHHSQFCLAEIRKFVLSADPATSPSDWIAFAVIHNRFSYSRPDYAFYRAGDRLWTLLAPAPDAEDCDWPDVEFHQRKFYVATPSQLLVCKLDGEPPRMEVLERAGPAVRSGEGRTFLVERGRELLFISLSESLIGFPRCAGRRELEVYKVKFLGGSRVEFLKQGDVGEHALFLGENHSFALNSICYPRCKRNTIYLACLGYSRILLIDLKSKMPAVRYATRYGFSLCPCYWYVQDLQRRGLLRKHEPRADIHEVSKGGKVEFLEQGMWVITYRSWPSATPSLSTQLISRAAGRIPSLSAVPVLLKYRAN